MENRCQTNGFKRDMTFLLLRTTVDAITWRLSDSRIRSMQIHGGLSQPARDRALNDFRNGRVSVLVATDVAARGLDLPGIDHVVNYEMPLNAEESGSQASRSLLIKWIFILSFSGSLYKEQRRPHVGVPISMYLILGIC